MATMRLAQVAGLSGVPAATLRYDEEIGLLAPAPRDTNGYRRHDDRDVERLRFITGVRQLEILRPRRRTHPPSSSG